MINKLLANLPFNPSLIEDVSFYAKRLRKEESIRRLGLILVIVSMFIQLFVALSPPEKSLAESSNDVLTGGKVTDIKNLRDRTSSRADVRALYARFGLGVEDMADKTPVHNFDFSVQGSRDIRTVGRKDFTGIESNHLRNVDNTYSFAGTDFYSRSASEWSDRSDTTAFYFGQQKSPKGGTYEVWVLKSCGNIAYRAIESDTVGTATGGTGTLQTTGTPGFTPVEQPATTTSPVTPAQSTTPETPAPHDQPPPATAPTPCPTNPAILVGDAGCGICKYNPALAPNDANCKPETCKDNPLLKPDDKDCGTVTLLKTAQNITKNLSPVLTLSTKAQASDIIEYSLVTTNTNAAAAKTSFVVKDYVADILDYATIDEASISAQGGSLSADKKTITWANQTIPAGGKLTNTFKVTLKNPIPSTNQPNPTAPDYDCRMENGYGNLVSINVDCPLIKQAEKLPNTGPGTTVGIAFGITVVSGYFFARSRLLAKELELVKKDFVTSGA